MKKITKTIGKLSAITASGFLLAACTTPDMYYSAKNASADRLAKIKDSQEIAKKQAEPAKSVSVKDSIYVDSTPIDLKSQPAWLKNKISLHGAQLPFSFYSRNILQSTETLVHYQQGLDESKTLSLNYEGTVKGALDALAAKTGYVYEINGNNITWKEFLTKTINVAFIPGSSDYMVGKDKSGSSSKSGSGNSGATVVVTGNDSSSENQYSNMGGKLSIWNDLEHTLSTMLSKQGKAIVSESTTSITVHDHPSNVKAIQDYIKQVNHELSKQVMVKVQVVDVKLTKSFNNGINWSLVQHVVGNTDFNFSGDFSSPISISSVAGSAASSAAAGFSSSASSVLLSALKEQGSVSTETEPTLVTTNDQVASLNITSSTGYLAEQETTLSGSDSDQVSTSLTPGTVNSGLTLFLLPRIIDNKVYLQVSSDISTLDSISDLFATGVNSGSSESTQADTSKIQVPNISQKQFNQRSIIKSGATMILAGYKQLHDEDKQDSVFNSDALGGKGAEQTTTETIVLITPYIISDDDDK